METITIQATGHPPFSFDGVELATQCEMLEGDKRGVELHLCRDDKEGDIVIVLTYVTTWGDERPVTRVMRADSLEAAAEWVRGQAPRILPPGAGFPATPSYETRQAKLAGLMETLTLHALSQALVQASGGAQGVNIPLKDAQP